MASVGVDGNGLPTVVRIAHLLPDNPSGQVWQMLDPEPPSRLDLNFAEFIKSLEDEIYRSVGARAVKDGYERAYLIGRTKGQEWEIQESMRELTELAQSGGLEVVGSAFQRREAVDPRFVVGKGKLREIVIDALMKGAGLVVFDAELSPTQVKAIADLTELKVIDRSQLILDIFAQRAKSREGKIQVELAQLKYALPRLGEKDDALSRLTGGIGGRGPGETRLEIDRRRIHSRIGFLENEIRQLGRRRSLRRKLRNRRAVPVISIVGYTNAGKSTLVNALTHAQVYAADQLFATLDPTSRRMAIAGPTPDQVIQLVLTDTVGFIEELPASLMDAFRATLEEVTEADALLHVVDVSHPAWPDQIHWVMRILNAMPVAPGPMLLVFNKSDRVSSQDLAIAHEEYPNALFVSATERLGLATLRDRLAQLVAYVGLSC